jgi:hypothetical protein
MPDILSRLFCMYVHVQGSIACIIMRDKQIRDGVFLLRKGRVLAQRQCKCKSSMVPSSQFPACQWAETWPVVPCMNQEPRRSPAHPSSLAPRCLAVGRRDGGMVGGGTDRCWRAQMFHVSREQLAGSQSGSGLVTRAKVKFAC